VNVVQDRIFGELLCIIWVQLVI